MDAFTLNAFLLRSSSVKERCHTDSVTHTSNGVVVCFLLSHTLRLYLLVFHHSPFCPLLLRMLDRLPPSSSASCLLLIRVLENRPSASSFFVRPSFSAPFLFFFETPWNGAGKLPDRRKTGKEYGCPCCAAGFGVDGVDEGGCGLWMFRRIYVKRAHDFPRKRMQIVFKQILTSFLGCCSSSCSC